jgi:hypothetical protein
MKKILGDRKALSERMKELHCLYSISKLFSQHSLSLERLLREIIRVIPRAWQYPERTSVRLTYGGREYVEVLSGMHRDAAADRAD